MATFVVKSNLNITVSIIKNAPDDMKFVRVINMNICFCPLVNICNVAVNFFHCDTPDGSTERALYRHTV